MAVGFTLDHERRLVDSRASGVLKGAEMLGHMAAIRELFDDGVLDASWSQVADFSEVTVLSDPLGDAVQDLARGNPWPRECRRVVVAPMTAVFGLSRMYQQLTGDTDQSIAVVRTRAEALDLLALDPAT